MAIVGSVVALALSAAAVAAQNGKQSGTGKPPDAAAHKQWMSDAGDVQEDLRDALAAKSAQKVATAAAKLETILAQTESYWASKKAGDVVELAKSSRTLARQIETSAKAGKLELAGDAFGKLGATCNACHDLHPEKR